MLISIGVLSLTTIQSRKIPGIIKKINKALGLSPKSEQLWDILPTITDNSADITNLKSCQTRWTINCDTGVWQQGGRDYAGQMCSNWYGWTTGDPKGFITTTFNGIGRAQLDFGNCFTYNTVKATLDGTVIATAPANTPSMKVEFDFHIGSILKITENGILQFNSLDILQCNQEIGNFGNR